MANTNSTILKNIWMNGTSDFQQRIPDPTQSSLDATMKAIFDPMNKAYYNQFLDSLIMRVGETYVHQQAFNNPLSVFKKSKLMYGSTMQEIVPKWIKAHSYNDEAEDVFKMERPDTATWFHSVNRRDRYDITIAETELHTAFTDAYGLNKLVAALMQAPINSDEYDEYRIMLQLIAFYEHNWGMYKHHLTAAPHDEATGKELLTAIRAYAGKLKFPNVVYNAACIDDVQVFVKPKELVLVITPETQAAIDVQTLSSVFQLDKADIKYRTILVDEFPIPDAVALLTTEDFFKCRDTVYQTASIYNPKTLATNYFLHHQGIYSVSPFMPAILFTTGEATTINTVTQKVTGIDVKISDTKPDLGDKVAITATLKGTLTPETKGIKVAPNAVTYDVTITRGTDAVNSPATRVDEYGYLHVSKRLEYDDKIKVVCTSTYVNPSGKTDKFTGSVEATVTKK